MAPRSWITPDFDIAAADRLAAELDLPKPLAGILVKREISDPAAARKFLNPNFRDLVPPDALPGVSDAVRLIWDGIRSNAHFVVFGDFDTDGVCSTAIMVRILRLLGARADHFLPQRQTEGYGLTPAAIDRCRAECGNPDFWITVDCGITAVDEVAALKKLGCRVVLTDHHQRIERLPEPDALIDPTLPGTPEPLRYLCGAGVAFKLAQALVEYGRTNGWYSDNRSIAKRIIAEVAVATVADIVPLVGENRIIVSNVTNRWGSFHTNGLDRLLAHRNKGGDPDTETFGFFVGPMINAAGRMESAEIAYQLLSTDNPDLAQQLARKMAELNRSRKETEGEIFDAAMCGCGLDGYAESPPAAVVVARHGWHKGVIGIVAARLCEKFCCPAAVAVFDTPDESNAVARGSVRAGAGYNVMAALSETADLLSVFGGHERAGGFTVKPGKFPEFRQRFEAVCQAQRAVARGETEALVVDGILAPDLLTLEFYREQQRLAPFGFGNPKPCWAIANARIDRINKIGADEKHLSLTVAAGKHKFRAVWFNHGEDADKYRCGDLTDIAFELAIDDYMGDQSIELLVKDILSHTDK